jgi:hypothetical protein
MIKWLKHAFALETNPATPSPVQQAAIDAICREIVRRHLTLPAQMILESSVPLHFLTGQFLRFIEPFIGVFLQPSAVKEFAAFLEKPGSVEYISRQLNVFQKVNE